MLPSSGSRSTRRSWRRSTVVDPYPVESYFQYSWEYPGAWYLVVAIPEGFRSRDAFIDFLVKETLKRQ